MRRRSPRLTLADVVIVCVGPRFNGLNGLGAGDVHGSTNDDSGIGWYHNFGYAIYPRHFHQHQSLEPLMNYETPFTNLDSIK